MQHTEKKTLPGTIASKINVTPKVFYFPISKLHSILAVANLLAHNNKSQICYCGQISLQSAAVNCSFSDNLTPLGVTFILRSMVPSIGWWWNRNCVKFYVREKGFQYVKKICQVTNYLFIFFMYLEIYWIYSNA